MKLEKIVYSLYQVNEITEKVYNEFNKVIKQNEYYIYNTIILITINI